MTEQIDMCTLYMIQPFVNRQLRTFIEVNKIYNLKNIKILLVINWFIKTNGTCYDLDVKFYESELIDRPINKQTTRSLGYMRKAGFLEYGGVNHGNNKGKAIYITPQGYAIIDNLFLMFKKEENRIITKIRKRKKDIF